VASLFGVARSELRYVVRDSEDREQDAWLAHRLGVNEFFCALVEAGRNHAGHGLARWVPERTVRTPDGWIRPDGFGVFLHPAGALDFYLEYDRGTETTRQLANKLAGYIGVARDWTEQGAEHFPCVLIVVPNYRRERLIATALADACARFKRAQKVAAVPFYVANEEALSRQGVLGKVWARLPKLDRRLAITELPAKEGLDYDLSDCIGRCFTEDAWARLMPLSRRPRSRSGSRVTTARRTHPVRGWSPGEQRRAVRRGRDRPGDARGGGRSAGAPARSDQAFPGGGRGQPQGGGSVRSHR
jgi:hypothetical protein